MEGNLVIVYAGEERAALEFAKLVFTYTEIVLVLTKNIVSVNEYGEEHDKEVITLQSIQEALDMFGPDKILRIGATGKLIDLEDIAGDIKEGKTLMLIFGDKKSDATMKKWVGDIAGVSILMYELDKLVDLGPGPMD